MLGQAQRQLARQEQATQTEAKPMAPPQVPSLTQASEPLDESQAPPAKSRKRKRSTLEEDKPGERRSARLAEAFPAVHIIHEGLTICSLPLQHSEQTDAPYYLALGEAGYVATFLGSA